MARPKNVFSIRLSQQLVDLIGDEAQKNGVSPSKMASFLLGQSFPEVETVESVSCRLNTERLQERAERRKLSRESRGNWDSLSDAEKLEILEHEDSEDIGA
jgi:hypothetical protein